MIMVVYICILQYHACMWSISFFLSSRRRHTRCALVTGVQTCALPIALRAIDNKDRWNVSLDPTDKSLRTRHRLSDPGWINWTFNDFGWMPNDRSLWLLSVQSGYSPLSLAAAGQRATARSEKTTSAIPSLMRTTYAVFSLHKKK